MKQRIFAGMIALTMMLPIPVFASDNRAQLDAVECELAQNVLDKLEVLEYSKDNFNDVISRVDFAIFLARLLKVNEYELTDVTYYTDLSADHYALKCVNYLTEIGAFDGCGDSEFRPDDPISPIEAAKVIFNVLGYRTYASLTGGYPKAYYELSDMTGLLKGFSGCENITRNELTVLLLRAGLTNTNEISAIEGKNITFESENSRTLFEKYWDIYEIEGVVTTVGDITLSDTLYARDGYLTLNGESYAYGEINPEEFLGRYITALTVKSDTEEDTFLYGVVNNRKTNEIYIEADKVESYNEYNVYYSADEKQKRAKIATDAKFIYNGTLAEYGISDKINNLDKGDIYLIDVTDDEYADTVIINEYKTYVVGYIDRENETIYDELSKTAVINLENYTHKKFYGVGGGELTMNSVSKGAVINVKESNGTYADIYVSSAMITGKVMNVYTDELTGKLCVKLDEENYAFDKNYTTYGTWFENGVFKGRVGESFSFYLDMFGEIAYVGGYSTDSKLVGYIIDIKLVEDVEEFVKIKLLKADGGIESFQTAEKTEVDGTKYKSAAAIDNAISNGDGKVIVYKLNDDNEITFIDTSYTNSERETKASLYLATPKELAAEEVTWDSNGRRQWFRSNQSYGRVIIPSTSTVVFVVPEDANEKRDEFYSTINWSSFEDGRWRMCQSYKFGEDKFYDDVIIEFSSSGTEVAKNASMFAVNSITQEVNVDNDIVYRLGGVMNGKEVSYIIDEQCMSRNFSNECNSKTYTSAGELKEGSLLQVTINSQGKISAMRLLVDSSENIDNLPSFSDNNYHGLAANSYTLSRVFCVSKKNEGFELSYTKGGNVSWRAINGTPTVTIIDTTKKKDMVSVGTVDDIPTFEMSGYQIHPMYVNAYRYNLRDIVVYK